MLKFQRLLEALFLWLGGSEKRPADRPDHVPARGEPEWLQAARRDLGIQEIKGPAANPAIMRAWEYVDYDPPDGDETSWCSAKLCEWMEVSGQPSTRAPNARSWAKWGHELKKPKPGCVAVFWRNRRDGWEGHVALYVGPGDRPDEIRCLGGNQSDSVSVASYNLSQLIGYRWPTTGGNSRTLRAQTAGVIGDASTMLGLAISPNGIIQALPDMLAISEGIKALAPWWGGFVLVGLLIGISARAVTVWARMSDWQAKGV